MQVYRNSSSFPPFKQAVVTIGTFDGVHTGHQQIIDQMKSEAGKIGGETVIITFHPHPRKIVNSASDIKLINSLLGYDFFFEGTVIEGDRLGRTLGYPTANLRMDSEEKLIPGNGVYAVTVDLKEGGGQSSHTMGGMMNIGIRPTVGGPSRVIEVNLFDFNQSIYGEVLRVYVKKHLRPEQKFRGLDALREQLAKDKELALMYLSRAANQKSM